MTDDGVPVADDALDALDALDTVDTVDAEEPDHELPPTLWDLSAADRAVNARSDPADVHGWLFQGDVAAYEACLAETGCPSTAPDHNKAGPAASALCEAGRPAPRRTA